MRLRQEGEERKFAHVKNSNSFWHGSTIRFTVTVWDEDGHGKDYWSPVFVFNASLVSTEEYRFRNPKIAVRFRKGA